ALLGERDSKLSSDNTGTAESRVTRDADAHRSDFPSRVGSDGIVDARRLLRYECLPERGVDQRAEMTSSRLDHRQELWIGDERLRLLRFRIEELRLEHAHCLHFGLPGIGDIDDE